MRLFRSKATIEYARDYQLFIFIGQIMLVISILVYKFTEGVPIFEFIEGMCTGLSLTFNVYGLLLYRKNKRDSLDKVVRNSTNIAHTSN